jgi:RNA polymerase sigma-70 factor (ECF subfamily)
MDDAATRLENLYRDVGPSLLAYLQRSSGDLHSAEDLLQETFVQASRRLEWLSRAVSTRAWLFAIARHVAVTALRRRRITRPLRPEMTAAAPGEDPRLEEVRAAIASLPDVLRETLELRLRAELSYEEIAEMLQIPVGTVRSRLHHAVRRLRAAVSGKADSV